MTPAARRLVVEHLELADRLASTANRGTPTVWQGDLHSAALEGLIAAAITYDPAKGTIFTSWAYACIMHAIADARQQLLTGRKSHRKGPDRSRNQDRRGDRSLEPRTTTQDPENTRAAHHDRNPLLEDPDSDPANIYAVAHSHEAAAIEVRAALATLTPTDRDLMRRYYQQGLTLAAIAVEDGITEGGVSYRLKRLRTRLRQTRTHDPNPDNH